MTIYPRGWQKIRIILLIGIFVISFILVLIEKHLLVARGTGRFQSTICQLPMELVGLGDDTNGSIDNPIADLAGISPAGIRFNLSIKNDVSGTITVWDKDKPSAKSLSPIIVEIAFGNDPNPIIIPYKSEKLISNNLLGFKAEYLQQEIIGKGFRCAYKYLNGENVFAQQPSSSTRMSFIEDNPNNFLFIARPTGTTLIAHFILLVAGLFGLIKLGESMVDFIKKDDINKN